MKIVPISLGLIASSGLEATALGLSVSGSATAGGIVLWP